MKLLVLPCAALLSACALPLAPATMPLRMSVAYGDLPLQTRAGRAALAARVTHAANAFCQAYDPMDPQTRFDAHLASKRHCSGAAAILLAQRMPASVRRAYQAGKRAE
ncbi:UrcA family protein [Sphingomonas sp. RS6]